MTQQEKQHPAVVTQSFIRKLTTEKAVKAHRQHSSDKDAAEDDITNITLAARGIKSIESLDLPSLRCHIFRYFLVQESRDRVLCGRFPSQFL